MKFPRFGTPFLWKKTSRDSHDEEWYVTIPSPDWMWTWKLDLFLSPKKTFEKQNDIIQWIYGYTKFLTTKKRLEDISPYLSSVNHGEIEDLTAADHGWPEAGHEEFCDLVFGEAIGLQAQPLHRWSLPIFPLHNHDEPHIKPPSSKHQKDTERIWKVESH